MAPPTTRPTTPAGGGRRTPSRQVVSTNPDILHSDDPLQGSTLGPLNRPMPAGPKRKRVVPLDSPYDRSAATTPGASPPGSPELPAPKQHRPLDTAAQMLLDDLEHEFNVIPPSDDPPHNESSDDDDDDKNELMDMTQAEFTNLLRMNVRSLLSEVLTKEIGDLSTTITEQVTAKLTAHFNTRFAQVTTRLKHMEHQMELASIAHRQATPAPPHQTPAPTTQTPAASQAPRDGAPVPAPQSTPKPTKATKAPKPPTTSTATTPATPKDKPVPKGPASYAAAAASAPQPMGQWQDVPKKLTRTHPNNRKLIAQRNNYDPAIMGPAYTITIRDAANNGLRLANAPTHCKISMVSVTRKGHLLMLTREDCHADELRDYVGAILNSIHAVDPEITSVMKQQVWHKIAVHGIDTYLFPSTTTGMGLLREEITCYNTSVQLLDNPRYYVNPRIRGLKRHSSVVISVPGIEMKKRILHQGLFISNKKCKASEYVEVKPTDTCSSCLGYGHHQSYCRSKIPHCKFCTEAHQTRDHYCPYCKAKGKSCIHTQPKCFRCDGPHRATDPSCPVVKALFEKKTGPTAEDEEVGQEGEETAAVGLDGSTHAPKDTASTADATTTPTTATGEKADVTMTDDAPPSDTTAPTTAATDTPVDDATMTDRPEEEL